MPAKDKPVKAIVVGDKRDTTVRRMAGLAIVLIALALIGVLIKNSHTEAGALKALKGQLHFAQQQNRDIKAQNRDLANRFSNSHHDSVVLRRIIRHQNHLLAAHGLPTTAVPPPPSSDNSSKQQDNGNDPPPPNHHPSHKPTHKPTHKPSHSPSAKPTCDRVPVLGVCKPTLAPHPAQASAGPPSGGGIDWSIMARSIAAMLVLLLAGLLGAERYTPPQKQARFARRTERWRHDNQEWAL